MALAILAGVTVLYTELLGWFRLLTAPVLALYWAAILALILWLGARAGIHLRIRSVLDSVVGKLRAWPSIVKAVVGLLGAVLLLLLAVALRSPPNNVDSLQYHLARVAHWAQSGSLQHYAASYHPQLGNAIGAEVGMLHLYLLSGGHGFVNLVQWSSLLGSICAISVLAAELGANRRGQILAVVFGVSAPVTILQATSTQTDLTVGFWVVASLAIAILVVRRSLTAVEWLALGSAIGMGMLTKATFMPYAFPCLTLFLLLGWRNLSRSRSWIRGLFLVLGTVLLLNLGYWSRNLATYGGMFGSEDWFSGRTSAQPSPLAAVARAIQEMALEFPTPFEELNEGMIDAVRQVSAFLGLEGRQFTFSWAWNHEDFAGNPVHSTLLLILLPLIVARGSRSNTNLPPIFALGAIAGFLGYSWVVEFDPFGARLHLPLFLMAGPIVGLVLGSGTNTGRWAAITLGLMLLAMPWILLNQSRPVFGWRPRTRVQSVFTATEEELMFANVQDSREPYVQGAQVVLESGCTRIGTSLDSRDPEYVLWWLLGAPTGHVEIASVRPLASLEHLRNRSFEPCGIFCTNCGDRREFEGLMLASQVGRVSIFLDE
jgi:4-amino-4-deoxy-L-arabinose transferase-like glycosyltransferase